MRISWKSNFHGFTQLTGFSWIRFFLEDPRIRVFKEDPWIRQQDPENTGFVCQESNPWIRGFHEIREFV